MLGFAALGSLSIGLGFLLTEIVLESDGIVSADERPIGWLAAHRSATLTDLSLIGSIMAGGVVLPLIAAAIGIAAAALREWRLAAFIAFALAVESATYRVTTLFVHRERPDVRRLEDLPVDASYPSGHTAAALAVYGGIALLLTSRFRGATVRWITWPLAVAIPVFVAVARMYRGMHHPLDTAGGVVIGVLALLVLVLVTRAAGAAAGARKRHVSVPAGAEADR
jgi:membrane-associated phospholipid phosphatase